MRELNLTDLGAYIICNDTVRDCVNAMRNQ